MNCLLQKNRVHIKLESNLLKREHVFQKSKIFIGGLRGKRGSASD